MPAEGHATRGDAAEVVRAFAEWLRSEGWRAGTEPSDYRDILASRDGEWLYCEAKESASEPGIDSDIGYGQLLRRMRQTDNRAARYALVIRDEPRSVRAALRVNARVRDLLRITLYAVGTNGSVRELR